VKVSVALVSGSPIIWLTIVSHRRPAEPHSVNTETLKLQTIDVSTSYSSYDLYVDSVPQPCQRESKHQTKQPIVSYRSSWYDSEGNGTGRRRWTVSPNNLWLYTPASRKFQLLLQLVSLHDWNLLTIRFLWPIKYLSYIRTSFRSFGRFTREEPP
jgi:hypothetical protein